VQFTAEVDPVPLTYVSAAQTVQLLPSAIPIETFSDWHFQHVVAFKSEKNPAGQDTQIEEFNEPGVFDNLNSSQLMQDVAPGIDANVPDSQGMQPASESTPMFVWYVPALHGRHEPAQPLGVHSKEGCG